MLLLLFGGKAGAMVATGVQITIAASGALTAPVPLTAAPAIRISVAANLSPPGFVAASGITVSVAPASLTAPAPLKASAGVTFGTFVAFGRPITAIAGFTIGTRATISPSPRESAATITIDGVDVRGRVRMKGLTIRDVLNDAPNTCNFVIDGAAPAVGQRLRITVNEGARVLFAGTVQTVAESFELQPKHLAWSVTAIDDTAAANQKRPFGTWRDTSATTIAQAIAAQFAPAFSTFGIAADLPPVSMTFDGTDTLIAALARLASAIGGYTKIEDATIYLFIDDPGAAPDPLDGVHKFVHDPPIVMTTDASQLRTRVYGKGYGENILADLAPGETLVPLANGATFSRYGGEAIAATTADGAQSQRVTFTGRELPVGGTLVGPGAAPSNGPIVALVSGAGIESGPHDYAYVFVTATGKTIPGPRTRVVVGSVPSPAAPTGATVAVGMGPEDGVHLFALSHVTAAGETLPGPTISKTTTSTPIAPPGTCPAQQVGGHVGAAVWNTGDTVYLTWAWENVAGVTTPGAPTAPFVAKDSGSLPGKGEMAYCIMPAQPSTVANARFYFNVNGAWIGWQYVDVWNAIAYLGSVITGPGAPPTSNTAVHPTRQVTLQGLEPSPALGTARKVWGTVAGGSQLKLIATINQTDTSYVVTTADAALGANAPTVSTATGVNRANVTWPAGPTGVTNIEIYRTAANLSQLNLLHSVGSNTAGTVLDSKADAALGAAAPTGDTSGLTQPSGQVNPGATALPVASPAPFRASGGWVILGGGQVVRYTGISGQSLTGVPAAGAGAITTTVLYGSQAIPSPILTGVSGITIPIAKGSAVHIWVQVDDVQAQAAQAARAGGDGVIEFVLVDTRRGAESLTARCQADLALFARPIVTVTYATRDLKTQSGKTVTIDLASPSIHEALIIQEVTITAIDIVPNLAPRFTVQASSVRFSLEDTLRRLVSGGLIVGGST